MKTKKSAAFLNQTLNKDAVIPLKRSCSSPLFGQSDAFSERRSHASSAAPESSGSGHSTEDVIQVGEGIGKMNVKDPVQNRSSVENVNEKPTGPRQTKLTPCPYRGLQNLGATCYLNATLQVLFMTKAFRERVLKESPNSENSVSALKEIFKELRDQNRGAQRFPTYGIIKSLGIQNVCQQEDAVECFLHILGKVGPHLAKDFTGTLRNNRKCSEDHHCHDESSFMSLQIPFKAQNGPYRLEDGINSYFESATLVEDDQMYCETCDGKRDTIWSCEIHKYPAILPLHLKRFVFDYTHGFVKNDCPMDVPLHLSLQEHKYSLYAVINHRGSLCGGHYTAVIRCFTDGRWYCFDDSSVLETDEGQLKRSREAYLLLYQKDEMKTTPLKRSCSCPLFGQSDAFSERRSHASSAAPESSGSGLYDVENIKEEAKRKTTEAGNLEETGRAELCGGAHSKPQMEEFNMTGHLRILLLGMPGKERNILAEMILREFSHESLLQHSKTIDDALEKCSPGPHMVLWVESSQDNKAKRKLKTTKNIYRFMGNGAREYIMIVLTVNGPTKNMMQKYVDIKNVHVLDMSADLSQQEKELVAKLRQIINKNHKANRPYYVLKPPKKKGGGEEKGTPEEEGARKKKLEIYTLKKTLG